MIFKNFVLKKKESLKKNLLWMLLWRTRFVIFMTFLLMYRFLLSLKILFLHGGGKFSYFILFSMGLGAG